MDNNTDSASRERLVSLIMDAFRRIMVHYGCWFRETEHQLGLSNALEIENSAGNLSIAIQLKRLAKILNFELVNGVPAALYRMGERQLEELHTALSANWLANDGVWFQAVENHFSMFDAKRCNDTCWSRFAPYEAYRIKMLVGLPNSGGLEALKEALKYRLYAQLNIQEVVEETENSFIFRMVECRVQTARKRKNLDGLSM